MVPLGNGDDVTIVGGVGGAAFIVILKDLVLDPKAFVARATKLDVAAPVGVPERTPLVFNVSPPGVEPDCSVQLIGAVPLAARVVL